jgi:hypothetical protein
MAKCCIPKMGDAIEQTLFRKVGCVMLKVTYLNAGLRSDFMSGSPSRRRLRRAISCLERESRHERCVCA